MKANEGSFRFTYFTDYYNITFNFYKDKMNFALEHHWDRSDDDKGALFKVGKGLIEILLRPKDVNKRYSGLDYRIPQGVFMGIQVDNIDELFEKYKAIGIPFKQEIKDQPWGHRSFYVYEPNGLILGFFQENY
ncbi:MAG: VOC family protein [Saprospiraceae bacterium]|nr:VOC family protein [Saprospiraceae bacterium]